MKSARLGGVVFACIALFSLKATAATLDFTTNNDAYIHNYTSDPVGGVDWLLAPFVSSTYSVYVYIGFDITAFQTGGAVADSVTFDLFGAGDRTNLGLSIYGLNDAANNIWSENTIDWNNAPGIAANAIDPAATTLLFSAPVSYTANGLISFSGTSFVDFINNDTDGLITFILSQPGVTSNNHAFNSKESNGNPGIGQPGDFAPALHISTVPVPAAVWLFGSGLLGLIGIARRKA